MTPNNSATANNRQFTVSLNAKAKESLTKADSAIQVIESKDRLLNVGTKTGNIRELELNINTDDFTKDANKLNIKNGAIKFAKLGNDIKGTIGYENGLFKVNGSDGNKLVGMSDLVSKLNMTGFNIKINKNTSEKVKAGDIITFINGTGTTVEKGASGIKYSVNKVDFGTSNGQLTATAGDNFVTAEKLAAEFNKKANKTDLTNLANNDLSAITDAAKTKIKNLIEFTNNNDITVNKTNKTGSDKDTYEITVLKATTLSKTDDKVATSKLVATALEDKLDKTSIHDITSDGSIAFIDTNQKISTANVKLGVKLADATLTKDATGLKVGVIKSANIENGAVGYAKLDANAIGTMSVNADGEVSTSDTNKLAKIEDIVSAINDSNVGVSNANTSPITLTKANKNISASLNIGDNLEVSNAKLQAKTTSIVVDGTGNITEPTEKTALIKAIDVSTLVKGIGFNVNSQATTGGTVSGSNQKVLVKSGEEVKFIAGKNINIDQNGKDFTFNTKDNVEFNQITLGDNDKTVLTSTDKGLSLGGNKTITGLKSSIESATANPTGTILDKLKTASTTDGTSAVSVNDLKNVVEQLNAGTSSNTDALQKDIADKLGLSIETQGVNKGKLTVPNITPLKDITGTNSNTVPNTIMGGINTVVSKLNDGITFKGNENPTQLKPQLLGSTFEVIGSDKTNGITYSSDNITTVYQNPNGNGKLIISMKDIPNFKGVVVNKDATKPTITIGEDGIVIQDIANGGQKPLPVSLTKDGLNNGGKAIKNVGAPIDETDAINKKYVDDRLNASNNSSNNLSNELSSKIDHNKEQVPFEYKVAETTGGNTTYTKAVKVGSNFYKESDLTGKTILDGKIYDTKVKKSADGKVYDASTLFGADGNPQGQGVVEAVETTGLTNVNDKIVIKSKDHKSLVLESLLVQGDKKFDNTANNNVADANAVVNTLLTTSDDNTLNKGTTVKDLQAVSRAGLNFVDKTGTTIHTNIGDTIKITGNDNINVKANAQDKSLEISLADHIKFGKKATTVDATDGTNGKLEIDGSTGHSGIVLDGNDGISVKGKDGQPGVEIKGENGANGTDGVIVLKGHNGTNNINAGIRVKNGEVGVDGKDGNNGTSGMTRLTYTDQNNVEHKVSTLDDGLKFVGNDNKSIIRKLNSELKIQGQGVVDLTQFNPATSNIAVVENTAKDGLEIRLSSELKNMRSFETEEIQTGQEGQKVKISKLGVENTKQEADGSKLTSLTNENGTTITKVDAGSQEVAKAQYGLNGVMVKDDANGQVDLTAKSLSFKKVGNAGTGTITGLADLNDASDNSSAVNKKYVDDKLNASNSILGNVADGRDGTNGTSKNIGLTAKDGLNGRNLTEKINAIRNGEAGNSVFTDDAGNRLIKANNGNYYKAQDNGNAVIAESGNVIVDKAGEKYAKDTDGTYKKVDATTGKFINPVQTAAPNIVNELGTLQTAAENGANKVDAPVQSLVNEKGETTSPIILSNVKGTLNEGTAPLSSSDARNKLTNAQIGLNTLSGRKLSNVATIGDLQTLSLAGLTFEGNDSQEITKSLGTKLSIKGEGTINPTTVKGAENNIVVVKDENSDNLVIKLNKDIQGLNKLELKDTVDLNNKTLVKLDKDGLKITDSTTGQNDIVNVSKTTEKGIEAGTITLKGLDESQNTVKFEKAILL